MCACFLIHVLPKKAHHCKEAVMISIQILIEDILTLIKIRFNFSKLHGLFG
jgi:hypothetical protein